MHYDLRIWEAIRDRVEWKKKGLLHEIRQEIASDKSIREFQSSDPIPWQLREIMKLRAEGWIQRLYDSCEIVHRVLGKEPTREFDAAVWAFHIEPFMMREEVSEHG